MLIVFLVTTDFLLLHLSRTRAFGLIIDWSEHDVACIDKVDTHHENKNHTAEEKAKAVLNLLVVDVGTEHDHEVYCQEDDLLV